jgi:integrase
MPRLTETRALRTTLPRDSQRLIWCSEIFGFGCRLLPSGVRSWVVQLRHQGKSHRITLGPVGVLPFEGPEHSPGAADLAKIALNAARRGHDPKVAIGRARNPQGATLAEVWEAYGKAGHPLLNAIGFKRPSSIKVDRYRWKNQVSRLAHRPAGAITTTEVQRWLDTIEGLGARSHALIQLKSLLNFAASRGLAETHKIALTPRPSRRVQNFLKPAELKRLDATLVKLIARQPERTLGFSALRLLLHTGMRKGEVLSLDWSNVDLDHRVIHLQRDKASGENVGRDVVLSETACEVLRSLPRLARGGYMFFGRRRAGHLIDLERFWEQALAAAKLRHVRIHDLRHSYAAMHVAAGTDLFVIGKLLGHRDPKTSARYAHLAKEVAQSAVDRAAGMLS